MVPEWCPSRCGLTLCQVSWRQSPAHPEPHLLVLAHQLVPLEEVLVLELLLDQLVPLLQVMLLHVPQGRLPVCGGHAAW